MLQPGDAIITPKLNRMFRSAFCRPVEWLLPVAAGNTKPLRRGSSPSNLTASAASGTTLAPVLLSGSRSAPRAIYNLGERAIGGGLAGAGTGAVIGAIAGGGRGAGIGAAVGGGLGAIAGAATTPSRPRSAYRRHYHYVHHRYYY